MGGMMSNIVKASLIDWAWPGLRPGARTAEKQTFGKPPAQKVPQWSAGLQWKDNKPWKLYY